MTFLQYGALISLQVLADSRIFSTFFPPKQGKSGSDSDMGNLGGQYYFRAFSLFIFKKISILEF